MKNFKIVKLFAFMLILIPLNLQAEPESTITLEGAKLKLNGSGYRSKFFIKVYEGFLYLPSELIQSGSSVTDESVVFHSGYPGAVKMKFVYSKVDAGKIKGAFEEGLKKNAQEITGRAYVSNFLSIFDFPVTEGDTLTLFVKTKNTVSVIYNNKIIDTIEGENIGTAVYKIYLGQEPADGGLKDGMLGK